MRAAVAVQSGIDNDFAHIGNLVARVYPAHMHFGKDVQDLHVPGCAGAARLKLAHKQLKNCLGVWRQPARKLGRPAGISAPLSSARV